MARKSTPKKLRLSPVALWLFVGSALIFLMVVVGGLTRLTESGLSIVDWRPITGVFPPLSDAAWDAEFLKYQTSPEFQKKNFHMDVHQFKGIFWLEYLHRLLGRVIGFAFLIPLTYFMYTRQISRPLGLKLCGIFLLGGLQGLMGWYMVKSGLSHDPRVSPYRLTAHLLFAFLLFALTFRTALSLALPHIEIAKKISREGAQKLYHFSWILIAVIMFQVAMGGLVAGNDAGLVYNSFPTMNGMWIPTDLWNPALGFRNVFENATMVQFNHRIGAYLVVIATIYFLFQHRKYTIIGYYKASFNQLIVVLFVQFLLGVLTLVHQVPISLASLHQAVSVVLFAVSLFINHSLCVTVRRLQKKNRA